jgi:hypothetical protein
VQRNIEMRRKDAVLLSFFAGTLLITLLVTIGAIIMPADTEEESEKILDWEKVILTLPVFRFFFMIILLLCLTSLCIFILRKYRVNYLFIFELDPHYKVTHIQIIRVRISSFILL